MAQYYLMLENGFDPEKDLSYYAIPWGSWKHDFVGELTSIHDAPSAMMVTSTSSATPRWRDRGGTG